MLEVPNTPVEIKIVEELQAREAPMLSKRKDKMERSRKIVHILSAAGPNPRINCIANAN